MLDNLQTYESLVHISTHHKLVQPTRQKAHWIKYLAAAQTSSWTSK